MKNLNRSILSASIIVASFVASTAHAGIVSMVFTSNDASYSVIGDIVFNNSTNGVSNGTSWGHDITSISGVVTGVGGGAISGLISNPNQPMPATSAGYIYDNVIYSTESTLDLWGVLFSTENGSVWNLYGNKNESYQLHSYDSNVNQHGTIEYERHHNVSPVPEPETWAMMLTGLGLLGATARTRKSHSS